MRELTTDEPLDLKDLGRKTRQQLLEVESRFIKRTVESFHDDCVDLSEVRRLIGRHRMKSWCQRADADYISVSRRLRIVDEIGLETLRTMKYEITALYLIVAKKTPIEMRQKLIDYAKSKHLTVEYARKQITLEAPVAPPKKEKPQQEPPKKSDKLLPRGWDEVGKNGQKETSPSQPVQGELIKEEDYSDDEFPSLLEIYQESDPEEIAELFAAIRGKPGEACPCCGQISKPASDSQVKKYFDIFWQHVPSKVGKEAAKRAFTAAVNKLLKDESMTVQEAGLFLSDRMRDWSQSADAQDEVKGKLHPRTWLAQGRYSDDSAAWNVKEGDSVQESVESSKELALKKEQMRLIRARKEQA